ncbi:MAG: hypothetical protein QM652_02130 [Legionella sp.]|uniref:hypothetical protein n=1 Tax=Legionella sp. TaxID=459 RepID=UPI0039E55145
MLFRELSSTDLMKKIKDLGITCTWMYSTIFYRIDPNEQKSWPLKEHYKSSSVSYGIYTEYLKAKQNDQYLVNKAQNKMQNAHFEGQNYNHPEASLKLHLSLNNIGEVHEDVLLGLIKLLTSEANNPENHLNFYFKIIDPAKYNDSRFKMNDQLTLYFDKYSSTGDVIGLTEKINHYLKQYLKENTQALGPKDSLSLNSFVSARFDTNGLLKKYDVYPFFDLELKKFFERHNFEDLVNLPLCALDAVFIEIITSKEITIPKMGIKEALSEKDSNIVQKELEKMLKAPIEYLNVKKRLESSEKLNNSIISGVDGITLQEKKFQSKEQQLLNQEAIQHFEDLLERHNKKHQISKENAFEYANDIDLMYEKIHLSFIRHRQGYKLFREFQNESEEAITRTESKLEGEGEWRLKDLFLDLWTLIKSLGNSLYKGYEKIREKHCFFSASNEDKSIDNSKHWVYGIK